MKKFLKILFILIGIVFLIFVVLIGIGLFVDFEYDDHIENGRYTYIPEEENKDNEYVAFTMSDYDKNDSELTYYDSIEKAILQSDLGLNPGNDGTAIRLTIPQLTEERRKEIVKVVHKKAEDAKVAVRNIRRDANDALKKEEKAKTITEDDAKDGLDQIQKLTDKKIKQIDELKAVKEKDVLEV